MCQCVSVHACMREKRERELLLLIDCSVVLGVEKGEHVLICSVEREQWACHNQTSSQMKHELFPSSENIGEPASLDRPPSCRATGPSGTGT